MTLRKRRQTNESYIRTQARHDLYRFFHLHPLDGCFYRGRIKLDWIFAVLTAVQLALAVMNVRLPKKIADLESVSEDIE